MEEEKVIKPYEISFLLRNEEDVAVVVKKLSELGAVIIKEGAVNYIRLAYPIKKEESAYFGYIHFSAEPEVVKRINGALKLESKVLRFLIVTPPVGKMIQRRQDFRREVARDIETPVATSKVEPLSNAELEEKLEEISK
jgi:small subunit ribosomal protein S6